MAYSVVPLDIVRHRDALLALWADHTYDPRKNSAAMDRFNWLYGSPERSCTWIAIETGSHAVIGACSVFRAKNASRTARLSRTIAPVRSSSVACARNAINVSTSLGALLQIVV